jgi:hypothetical protein
LYRSTILAKLVVYISVVLFQGRILYAKGRKIIAIEKENKEKQITEAKFEALSNQMNLTLF